MKALSFLKDLFGFKRNSKYVRKHLNDSNIKSSIYMSFIIIALEIWMIIRQTRKYINPYWNNPSGLGFDTNLQLVFGMTSLYWLFIVCSLSMFIFGLFYVAKKRGKKSFITNLVLGSLCVLWILFLIPEINLPTFSKGTTINKTTTLLVYLSMPIFGASIIGNSFFRLYKGKDNTILSIIVILCFALVCLLFGIKVGYSDYTSLSKPKMIICFLTMITFVACLLIWKPYISIIMLTTIFIFFMELMKSFDGRIYQEGDEINYITFLVGLTVITITIYQQRVQEAIKDEILIHDANYDRLTNIHNSNYFISKILEKENADPSFLDNKIYLFINISNFKIINTQKGFAYGDKFLVRMAKDVEASFPNDYSARLADDHFVVLTDISHFQDEISILQKLVQSEADGLFIVLKVGGYKAQRGENPSRAIDKARYACGKINKTYDEIYKEYDATLDHKATLRQYIVNHLNDAIQEGYIKPFYQPVVWSNDQSVCGAECLARWIDPIYGNLSPREFIPVLEETRLIHKLDKHILEYACKELRKAIDEGREIVPISINFSRLDFELMNVKDEINERVEKYNIDKNYIHIELTESALSENVDLLNKNIEILKNEGYGIWLDDFGSGYSSLNSLKDFMFDVIKIDMKFLSNFDKNERTKDVLDCIIKLATRLGMKTLTEGVETKEEAEFLNEIGCGRLQGYLFGKPLSLEDFEQAILDKKLIISNHII